MQGMPVDFSFFFHYKIKTSGTNLDGSSFQWGGVGGLRGDERGWAGGGEGSWRPGVSNSSISTENPEFLNDLGGMWEII